MNNISPFMCSLEDVLKSEILQVSKRKLTNNFNFSFAMKTDLKYDLNFQKIEYTEVNLSNIITNMSFRDIIIFMRTSTYIGSLLGEDLYKKLDELTYFSNKKKEWEDKENDSEKINEESKTKEANETIYYLNMESLDILFIDNQKNSFMPFLNIKSGKLSIKYIYIKLGEQSAEIIFLFMIYVFNYFGTNDRKK